MVMTDFTQDISDAVTVSEENLKTTSKNNQDALTISERRLNQTNAVRTEGLTLADVLAKRGVKVLADSITMADATVAKDAEGSYSTSRYNNPDDALAALVTKINTIANTKTLNMIDVTGGYGGARWIGQLLWEKD